MKLIHFRFPLENTLSSCVMVIAVNQDSLREIQIHHEIFTVWIYLRFHHGSFHGSCAALWSEQQWESNANHLAITHFT